MIFGSMIAGKENTFSGSPPCTFKTEPSKKNLPDCFTAAGLVYSVELLTIEREGEEAISGVEKTQGLKITGKRGYRLCPSNR